MFDMKTKYVHHYLGSLAVFFLTTGLLFSATVSGKVVDDEKHAIEGAIVTIDDLSFGSRLVVRDPKPPFGSNVIPETKTDKNGHFTVAGLIPAKYRVFARKVEDGYGDTGNSIYAAGRPPAPTVDLASADSTSEVTVNLGRPGSIIKFRAIDAATGACCQE